MARLKAKAKQLAQVVALRGETDTALTQLTTLLAEGDYGAAASLAEVDAFRGDWPAVVAHATLFLAPTVLLTDDGLYPLMTKERAAWVLATPRGPEALKLKKETKAKRG